MTNRKYVIDDFHNGYGTVSDYPEEKALEYAKVEMLCVIADILVDIAENLKK